LKHKLEQFLGDEIKGLGWVFFILKKEVEKLVLLKHVIDDKEYTDLPFFICTFRFRKEQHQERCSRTRLSLPR
jgi:hypothetical protein